MSEEMTQIAASEYLERGYMMGAVESGEVLKDGAEAFATSEGVLVEYAAESGYVWGELLIPWSDVLKHAPRCNVCRAICVPGPTSGGCCTDCLDDIVEDQHNPDIGC